MKSLITYFVILISLSCFSQGYDESKFATTSSGLKYLVTEKGRGVQAENGDKVTVHYNGKLSDGTVFDNSFDRKQPFTFTLGQGQVIKGWDEGIALLHQGDKATLIIPAELGYGPRATGKIPANSVLYFDVELVNVQKTPKVEVYDTTGIKAIKTESGLLYYPISESDKKAPKPVKGERVEVHYSGYLTDGKMFDSSVQRGEPIKFELGAGQVISGWDEGIALMKKGDKARLYIPYPLAYGEQGRQPIIPAKSDLIFDVELINIYPEIKVEPFNIKGKKEYTTESGIKYYIIEEKEGEKVIPGATVKVNYTGYLEDGSIFDSSVKREMPLSFQTGKNRVIKGWEEGVAMMKTGEKFRFIIPSTLAYGEKGYPPIIPANATLTFDIELLEIVK